MGLTLKNVYDMRNGIIDFSNKLFSKGDNLVFDLNNEPLSNMLKSISFNSNTNEGKEEKVEKVKGKKKEKVKDPVHEKNKKDYIKDLKEYLFESQETYAKHIIGLDVYDLLREKYKELLDANKGKENDPVIVEFGKNIDIFKSQLLKNGVYNFEIQAKEKRDKDLDSKIRRGVQSEFNDINAELMEKNHVTARNKDLDSFRQAYDKFLDMDNLYKFSPKEINNNTSTFYGLLKNAGFSYAKKFETNYYEMPERIEECPSGYKFNEKGEMVEKESNGFFQSISNFFGRLFNSGKVKAYNEALKQSIEALHDEDVLKDVEDMKKLDDKKKLVDLGKEFDKENEISKDYQKELIAERKLMQEKESEKIVEEPVGPGLDQLD